MMGYFSSAGSWGGQNPQNNITQEILLKNKIDFAPPEFSLENALFNLNC